MADAEWKAETQGDLGAIDQKRSAPLTKGTFLKEQSGTSSSPLRPHHLYHSCHDLQRRLLDQTYDHPRSHRQLRNSSAALVLGGFMALILAFIMFVPRKLLSFKDFMSNIATGINTMVPAYIILTPRLDHWNALSKPSWHRKIHRHAR